jgi:uncharacterized protein (DUF2236 family)
MSAFMRRAPVTPAEDYGFFGPGSVTWRVWGHATSLTVGFQRAVVVEELDPFLLASVQATDAVRTRPRSRYDRTIRYFATVAFGDARTAIKASELLVKVHSRAVGIEPVSGLRYDANDPDSQLWILLTGWHSVLYAYERYGPGKLSPADEAAYWEQCAIAAELQTCDPAAVPRSREGVRAYFAAVRPRLAASEATQAMMQHLLDARAILPAARVAAPATATVSGVLRAATIATMPRWMRELGGLRQPAAVDAAVVPVMRAHFRAISLSTSAQLAALSLLSPSTRPVVEPAFRGVPAQREETLTPAQARERYGSGTPLELAHARAA